MGDPETWGQRCPWVGRDPDLVLLGVWCCCRGWWGCCWWCGGVRWPQLEWASEDGEWGGEVLLFWRLLGVRSVRGSGHKQRRKAVG